MRNIPKQDHAEAVKLLDQAAAILDQAYSLLKSARTDRAVETRFCSRFVVAAAAPEIVERLAQSARETVCDDCDQLIADCQCEWSNQGVPNAA
jgi:hypothetical protein